MTNLTQEEMYQKRKQQREELIKDYNSGKIENLNDLLDIAYAEGLQSVLTEFLNLKMS